MGAASTGADVMLRRLLEPLSQHYADDNTVEIRMVRPEVVVTDRRGEGKGQQEAPALSLAELETICTGLANFRGLKFSADDSPKLSCILPGGHRFECLVGPSVQSGVSLAIRCKHPFVQIGRASCRERVFQYV